MTRSDSRDRGTRAERLGNREPCNAWIDAYRGTINEPHRSCHIGTHADFAEQVRGFRYRPRKNPIILPIALSPRDRVEHFTGIVDAVRDDVAYLTLTDDAGFEVEIEWDAADLRSRSIDEGHHFHLTTTTRGKEMTFEFRPVTPKPLSETAKREIEDLLSRYRDRGLLDDDEP